MKNCDVFFSYSAEGDTDKWVPLLAEKLKRVYQQRFGEELSTYVYQARPNEDIRQQIQAALASGCFVPIANKKYFSSHNCFLEWREFKTHEAGRLRALERSTLSASSQISNATRFIVPVWRGTERFNRERARELFRDAWTNPSSGQDSIFGSVETVNEVQGTLWLEDLMTSEVIDFGEFFEAGKSMFETNTTLIGLVEKLANKLHPLIQATRQMAASELPLNIIAKTEQILGLSAFGLRLDRFEVGGWGFTLGREFERDVDGEFLRHGRHEVALLVTRALKSFFKDEWAYREELSKSLLVFGQLAEGRRTPFAVKDRKDEIAALIAGISWDQSLCMRLGDWRQRIRKQIEQDPFTLRWVIDTSNGKGGDGDEVIFFDFVNRILSEWNNKRSEVGVNLRDANKGEAEENFTALLLSRQADALKALKKWVSECTILFAGCDSQEIGGPSAFLTRMTERRRTSLTYEQVISELLLLRVAATQSDGAGAIAEANRFTARRGVRTRFQPLLKAIGDWIRGTQECQPAPRLQGQVLGFVTLCLLVVDELVHHIASEALSDVRKELLGHWCSLLEREECATSLLAADSVAWASIVLLFERFTCRGDGLKMPTDRMNELWGVAGLIRDERSLTVKSVLSQRNGGVKPELLSNFYGGWEDRLREKYPNIYPKADCGLFSIMGVFGGFDQDLDKGIEVEHYMSPFGRLEIDHNGTIERANDAFNLIYMRPFARISGIGITSVERLIQEFGDQDEDFIKVLGDTVVEACAPLDGRDQRQTSSFVELSDRVQKEVASARDKASTGYGVKDLLILKGAREQDEPRIVIRICSSEVHATPSQGVAAARYMTVWSFIDITSDAQDLWPIVERISSLRRGA